MGPSGKQRIWDWNFVQDWGIIYSAACSGALLSTQGMNKLLLQPLLFQVNSLLSLITVSKNEGNPTGAVIRVYVAKEGEQQDPRWSCGISAGTECFKEIYNMLTIIIFLDLVLMTWTLLWTQGWIVQILSQGYFIIW